MIREGFEETQSPIVRETIQNHIQNLRQPESKNFNQVSLKKFYN
jgi:hypothetical protein